MKFLKRLITIISTLILGCLGGQGKKSFRRFGIPGLALLMGKFKKNSLPFILLIPILLIGYGENSLLMTWLKSEVLVRLFYGSLLSLPFLFFGIKRWLFALITLCIAFSIRAGSLGQVWGMDILVEDLLRYGSLGVLIAVNLFS